MNKSTPITNGSHHIGLTVSRLEESARFFIDILGWSEVRRDLDYPAIFVSDGTLMITLWGVKTESPVEFNKNENVGLHHLALSVDSFETLEAVYKEIKEKGLKIEFSPELLRDGPANHMMCYEPSGIRVEFIHVPK
ncbi:MAG: VOC family protein [gamma proteobacterium endosymbiont of Lamellibrachia anaximandri]|nr:VOC family protein [gamma proteobacterium endosymbiont of Lamellibrachia anaximandri]MBL3535856.1 VOC family protein [gamma proteobacterium endosymbiont of Lamellibrachia anaximandri]